MKNLQFNPAIYRIKTESATGTTSWDLLTVDGSNPKETIYFMLKNDLPSHNDSDAICAAIDSEEWEVLEMGESGTVIDDYCIDISVFESAGEAYEVIKDSLLYI